jgi:ABC-type glycerol-3-phosphate transport system substrate-binding protein
MSKFQIALLVVFGLAIVGSVMVFSFYKGKQTVESTVVLWGDIPKYDWDDLSSTTGLGTKGVIIEYVEKDPQTMMQEFTEALAEGNGPDAIIMPLDKLWEQKSRLMAMPYESITERDFKSTFIEGAEPFMDVSGVYALPISVDPLVLYYNRDHLTRAGMPQPLAYWDEIYTAATRLTERDPAGNITKSIMALGEANNIPHYKDILSMLFMQAGTPITALVRSSSSSELRSVLNSNFDFPLIPAEAALDFYTQFSNPAKSFYSWNRSMLPAETHFIAGDSTYYIGYASEFRLLRSKNPSLNIGVALVPQSRASGKSITFAEIRGIAIARASKDPGSAMSAVLSIISKENVATLSNITFMPPVRRDLLLEKPGDDVLSVFYNAALQSRGWLDPDDDQTKVVFKEMIESVTSGRARISEAVTRANREVEALIKQ